jgi:hypothetical protein
MKAVQLALIFAAAMSPSPVIAQEAQNDIASGQNVPVCIPYLVSFRIGRPAHSYLTSLCGPLIFSSKRNPVTSKAQVHPASKVQVHPASKAQVHPA